MGYYVSRNGQQSGPYEEAVVRQYLAEGSLFPSDHAREASSPTWTTLGALFPGLGAPPPPAAAIPVPSGPVPPSLHWALVLLFGMLTCGIFTFVWIFIQASFVRKLNPRANFMIFLILWVIGYLVYIGAYVSIGTTAALHGSDPDVSTRSIGMLGMLAFVSIIVSVVFLLVGIFKMRSVIVEHYNSVEPIGLRLSGVMTFFFSVYYFQHHFTRIANYKSTGYLSPQG